MFVGRSVELDTLADELVKARDQGRCLLVRGRRRVGKSTLIEEFVRSAGVPALYFTAQRGSLDQELANFTRSVAESSLPEKEAIASTRPSNWNDAFQLLRLALPDDSVSIVVMDEVPYLMDPDHAFEGILQMYWDRYLSRKPVLLVLIGSDLSMMVALNEYDRPFHQRGREMVIGPLNPAEIGGMTGLDAASAIDASLLTGGLPLICADWNAGTDMWSFLSDSLANPTSPLIVSAERSLAAEFPVDAQARTVLTAIGSGERTFSNIARAAGDLNPSSLNRALRILIDKRMVVGELPISTRPSKEKRYRVTDPYLRFWLRFIARDLPDIERLRGDLVVERIRRDWSAWRGRVVEPLLRDALARLLPDNQIAEYPRFIGAYWTRTNDVEIDIVGADNEPVAKRVHFVGSIKWLDRAVFGERDQLALYRHRQALVDQPVPLVGVSRAGFSGGGLDARYGPEELIRAWRG